MDAKFISTVNFSTAGHIVFGNNAIFQLSQHLANITNTTSIKTIIILADNSIKRSGIVDEITSQLRMRNIDVHILKRPKGEPTIDGIKRLVSEAEQVDYDMVMGIGGGSVLDTAKLLAVSKTNSTPIEDWLGTDLIQQAGVPLVLVPTTAGTGSEVTPNAIVTLPEQELKVGIVSNFLLPRLTILDPLLTVTLPQPITAATGMDAFTHAFESFISNKANAISDTFALKAMRLISKSILEAYQNGESVDARRDMLLGSTFGGMALTSSGTAAVHALAYPLGGKFHITHGVANSMLLPHVTAYNKDAIKDRLYIVAKVMGVVTEETRVLDLDDLSSIVIEKLKEWTKVLEIPQNLGDFGVSLNDIPGLAEAAAKVKRLLNNNPKILSLDDIEWIYKQLLPIK